ncbi:diaminopimelate decarboxylase [Sansalvadorimonas sp. 2012CJ34-2]|uniref:Diaminopimelate decarboxylase n=1 Tax=Parendozoicomonas callyspongiae TaxID=2942213 RepID=A0ABT0PLA8_9GAMM|nr:diaminopimelate decarboxylase [Sansalvadorimonas sp. 2012CJ34-2]MCL6272162.1 diaminopimelate decarboxylase [Sansalvadorimonas sp. 2012CJ34-2]
MSEFHYQNGEMFAEQVSLTQLAESVGTPAYVYSRSAIEAAYQEYAEPLADMPHKICFAVKANSNLGVLNVLAKQDAGFDIVSVGELERVIAAGGKPDNVVFSGVGKQDHEICRALEVGVWCFNIESIPELDRLQDIAADMGKTASVSLRVNPNVDAQTHPYISTGLKDNKFGIDIEKADEIYLRASRLSNISIQGVDCHIGSQLTSMDPFLDALDLLLALVDRLAEKGIKLSHLDLGGGLGVTYKNEQPPAKADFIKAVRERIGKRKLSLVLEPGRSIIANAGVLLTRVELLKHTDHKNFAVIDGAMNDLIRPALYGSWHAINPVIPRGGEEQVYDVVGPVCETSDFLGKERSLCLESGDLLAVMSAGAYGMVMASNFNTRGRPAEVMVDGSKADLVRRRETVADQLALECLPGEKACF